MKTQQLMLGDWVSHNGTPKTVDVIWGKEVSLDDPTKVWGSIYTDKFNEDEIEPIPLTPEILEKNGFSLQSDNTELFKLDTYWLGCELGTFRIHNLNKDWWQFGLAKIRYVHELQHAMRLCGIEKEIEL